MKVEKYNFRFFIIVILVKIVIRREKFGFILNFYKCVKYDYLF